MKIYEIAIDNQYANTPESIIDNQKGWGSVPNNAEVDYFGLRVKMTPSTFLSLALPVGSATSVNDIANHIQNGGKIGSPFLDIKLPSEWLEDNPEDNIFLKLTADVSGHEGRNRMLAIKQLMGDAPVETHLFFRGYVKRRHLTPEIIKAIQYKLRTESGDDVVRGNIFEVIA